MVIYGPDTGGDVSPNELQQYAKKTHVNAQDSLHVLKAGDSMTGNLNIQGNRLQNFPFQPINTSDACALCSVPRLLFKKICNSRSKQFHTMGPKP